MNHDTPKLFRTFHFIKKCWKIKQKKKKSNKREKSLIKTLLGI